MDAASECEFSYVVDERSFVSLLIDLYRQRPELWKIKHPDYCDKRIRAQALQGIVKELSGYRPDYTEEMVKKKINILRTNFNKTKRRIEAARQQGTEDFKPMLWYFNEMLFLSEQDNDSECGMRLSNTYSETAELSDSADQKYGNENESDCQTTPKKIQKKVYKKKIILKRPRIDSEAEKEEEDNECEPYMTVTTTYFKKPKTKEDILTKNWAVKLKKLVPEQRLFAEKIINDVLFEGQLGNLTRNGVSFCPAF